MVWLGSLRAHSRFILASCCVAVFSDIFFYGILPPTLPYELPGRLEVNEDQVQIWVAVVPALYSASMVICSPIAGVMSDRCDKRRPLFIGAVVLQIVGVSLIIAASSLAVYIVGVVIAGCSSGFVWASSLALVLDSTSEDHIASAMSYVGLSISCGVLVGPVLGGIVYHAKGHYVVWSMCLGLIGLDLSLRLIMIEGCRTSKPATNLADNIELPEKVRAQGQIANGTTTSDHAASYSRVSQDEKATSHYTAVFALWKSPRFSFAIFATICLAIALTSFDGALPVYVEDLFEFSSRDVGLLYLALAVPAFIQPLIGWLVDKHGGRLIGTAGFLLSCPALVCLRFVDHDSLAQKVLLVVLLAIIGAALAATIPVYMAEVSCVVLDDQKHGLASYGTKGAFAQANGLWSAAYSIGCTIGPLWGGWIQKAAGWKTETWTVALLCGFVAIPAAVFTGGTKICLRRRRGL